MATSATHRWRRKTWVTCLFGLPLALSAGGQQTPPAYDKQTKEALNKGIEANQTGKYADAIKAFKEANKIQRNACFDCYMGLAIAYRDEGDARSAEENVSKAVGIAADAHERALAHTLKGTVLMSFAAGDAKKLALAEAECRQALTEEKEYLSARYRLGVVLLMEKRDEEGSKELNAFLSVAPIGSYAEEARKLIANPKRARERFAPEFEVTTLQGEKMALSRLPGKIVVLDFWATWCAPCRAALPEIKDLLKKYPREKLILISISGDADEKAWKEYVAKKGMDWPQCRDKNDQLGRLFGVRSIPTFMVIDGEGIIRQVIRGENPWQSVAYRLRDTLKSLKELE